MPESKALRAPSAVIFDHEMLQGSSNIMSRSRDRAGTATKLLSCHSAAIAAAELPLQLWGYLFLYPRGIIPPTRQCSLYAGVQSAFDKCCSHLLPFAPTGSAVCPPELVIPAIYAVTHREYILYCWQHTIRPLSELGGSSHSGSIQFFFIFFFCLQKEKDLSLHPPSCNNPSTHHFNA